MGKRIFILLQVLSLVFLFSLCNAQGLPPNPPDPKNGYIDSSIYLIPHDLVAIYPNPFSDYLNILFEFSQSEKTVFLLYDLSGRAIIKKELSEIENKIYTTDVLSGLYIAKIITSGRVTAKLIVK